VLSVVRTEIWTGSRNNKENLSILCEKGRLKSPSEIERSKRTNKTNKSADIDAIDLQIIEKLAADSRASFNRIAKQLKISTDTVARRYNTLKKDGVIKSLIQVDSAKLGYAADVIISIAVNSEHNLMETIETVEEIPDIVGLWKTAGAYDLEIYGKIRTLEELIDIQDEVSKLPGVTKMDTVLINRFPLMPYPREHMSDF
jgi:DNA-binding Lrp family transcriptional regulator